MQRHELNLYGQIGASFFDEGNDAKSVVAQIKAAGALPIDVHIHSAGGSVFDGYTIYNALAGHAPGVDVYIDGVAASIAAYVAMAGQKVTMADNAMLMIHNPTIDTGGRMDGKTMKRQMELLDKVTQSYADAFVKRGVLTEDQVKKMMADETWFTAPEALLAGLVDDISPELALAASFDLSEFKHTPPEILAQAGTKPSKKPGSPQSPPKGYPQSKDQYADPENYKYPIDTEAHTRAAWSYINKSENRSGYSASELTYMENRIKSAAKKFGIKIAEEKSKETEGRFDISATGMDKLIAQDTPPETPEPAPEPAPPPPPPEEEQPSTLDKLRAMLKPKADLQAEISRLKSQIDVRNASIVQLNAEIAALRAEAAELPAIKKLVAELEAERKSVDAAAADKVAALGFPSKDLPAASPDKEEKKKEEVPTAKALLEELNKITDPMEFTRAYNRLRPKIQAAWQASKASGTLTP